MNYHRVEPVTLQNSYGNTPGLDVCSKNLIVHQKHGR